MAHYLEVREVDKALVKGVKVFNHDALEGKYTEVFRTVRTLMNDTVRNHFEISNLEWDHDMFVMNPDDAYWLQNTLWKLIDNIGDQKECEKISEFCGFLNKLDFTKDKAYLICWGK